MYQVHAQMYSTHALWKRLNVGQRRPRWALCEVHDELPRKRVIFRQSKFMLYSVIKHSSLGLHRQSAMLCFGRGEAMEDAVGVLCPSGCAICLDIRVLSGGDRSFKVMGSTLWHAAPNQAHILHYGTIYGSTNTWLFVFLRTCSYDCNVAHHYK